MIPSKRQVSAGHFKIIDGKWHKRCRGPAHEEPVWLPATEKYFYPCTHAGKSLRSRCRLCENWAHVQNHGSLEFGRIEVGVAWKFYQEAVSRIGAAELSRRTGITYTAISDVLHHRVQWVLKRSLRAVMLELISIKRKGEYSINNHSRWRNERRLINPEHACKGCGVNIATDPPNYTEGCDHCSDRKGKLNRTPEQLKRYREYDRKRRRRERERKQAA